MSFLNMSQLKHAFETPRNLLIWYVIRLTPSLNIVWMVESSSEMKKYIWKTALVFETFRYFMSHRYISYRYVS